MKTYILKRPIYNNIDIPIGSIVKINDAQWEVEVVNGKLKGEVGHIADGVYGYVIDNTKANRLLIKYLLRQEKDLEKKLKNISLIIDKIPNSVL